MKNRKGYLLLEGVVCLFVIVTISLSVYSFLYFCNYASFVPQFEQNLAPFVGVPQFGQNFGTVPFEDGAA